MVPEDKKTISQIRRETKERIRKNKELALKEEKEQVSAILNARKEEQRLARESTRLYKFQTNLTKDAQAIITNIALKKNTSEAAVAREFILEGIARFNAMEENKRREESTLDRVKPTACPNCGATKNEIDEPVLVVSRDKWSCFECGAKGTW
jgi:hypothetical protein